MLTAPDMKSAVQWYVDAAVQAGRDVVQQGRIAEETQAILDRPLVGDPGKYADIVNAYWSRSGVEMPEVDPQGASHTGDPLEPSDGVETVRDLVSRLPQAFSSDAASNLRAVIQFDIADEEPGAYYLDIADGSCSAYEGTHPSPRMRIHAPADVWLKVCSGELDGAAAFISGQYRVSGDVALLMRFRDLFTGS